MIVSLLSRAMMMSTPLLFGSLSEVFSERTGVMVTAIEGIFLMGAWAGFTATYLTGSLGLGILFSALSGLLVAILYAFIVVTLKQHQIVTGTAINILIVGLCSFLQRVVFGVPLSPLTVEPLKRHAIPLLSEIPLLGPIFFNQNILTYSIYALVPLGFFILYKTSLGLVIRSTGENPEAVDVSGINVSKVRFYTVAVSGIMCGIAGAFYSIGYLGMFTTNMIGGERLDRLCNLLSGELESGRSLHWNGYLWISRSICHFNAIEFSDYAAQRTVYIIAVYTDDNTDNKQEII